jgi:large subunit ribosomal protein L10
LKRTEKEELVGTLAHIFGSSQVGFLVDYRGLNVAEITELRRRLHNSAATMRILKNRIAKRAVQETPFAALQDHLVDTRALIYGAEPVEPAKAVSRFLGENEKLHFIAGVLVTPSGASLLDAGRLKALGNLPSREQLLTQLVFVLMGTQTRFVRTLNEVPAKFVRTLAALAAAREKGA